MNLRTPSDLTNMLGFSVVVVYERFESGDVKQQREGFSRHTTGDASVYLGILLTSRPPAGMIDRSGPLLIKEEDGEGAYGSRCMSQT